MPRLWKIARRVFLTAAALAVAAVGGLAIFGVPAPPSVTV
jgi:hypothetical protein